MDTAQRIWAAATSDALPGVMRRLEGLLNQRSRPDFLEYVSELFQDAKEGSRNGIRDLLLESHILSRAMLHPGGLAPKDARTLLGAVIRYDSMFDTRLMQNLLARRTWPDQVPLEEIMRALELMEICPDPGRLSVALSKFARHPNARVQSKAAKILGRSASNLEWLRELFRNMDARVRANLIEGIAMRENVEPYLDLVRMASRDQADRVSTMALALLAQRGHGVSRALLEMRRRSKVDAIRLTAEYAYGLLVEGRQDRAETAPVGEPSQAEPKAAESSGLPVDVQVAVVAAV